MKDDDKKRFVELMNFMTVPYQVQFGGDHYKVYFEALKEHPFEAVSKAVNEAIKTEEFLPKPATILKLLGNTTQDKAVVAWNYVVDTAKRLGRDRKPSLGNTIDKAIQYAGGWERICNCDVDKLDFVKRQFVDGFNTYIKDDNNYTMLQKTEEPRQIENQEVITEREKNKQASKERIKEILGGVYKTLDRKRMES